MALYMDATQNRGIDAHASVNIFCLDGLDNLLAKVINAHACSDKPAPL